MLHPMLRQVESMRASNNQGGREVNESQARNLRTAIALSEGGDSFNDADRR